MLQRRGGGQRRSGGMKGRGRTGGGGEEETCGAGAAQALTERRLGDWHIKKVSRKPHTCEPSSVFPIFVITQLSVLIDSKFNFSSN